MNKPGQIQIAMLDNALRLGGCQGETTITTVSEPIIPLKKECKNQIIGYLSKYLCACFNHHCVGMSSYATGVASTLAYVKVLQFHLIMSSADEHGKGVSGAHIFRIQAFASNTKEHIREVDYKSWENNHRRAEEKAGKVGRKIIHWQQRRPWGHSTGNFSSVQTCKTALWFNFGPKFGEIYICGDSDSQLRILNNVLGHGRFGFDIGAKKGEWSTQWRYLLFLWIMTFKMSEMFWINLVKIGNLGLQMSSYWSLKRVLSLIWS